MQLLTGSPVIKLWSTERELRIVARQDDRYRKAAADAIDGSDATAQSLDIAAYDPETKAGMSRRLRVQLSAVPGARGEVSLEHVLELGGLDARALVVDLQLDRLAARRQGNNDRAAARREADGVLQHVLQHHLEHAMTRPPNGPLVEATDKPEVLRGGASA